MTIAVAELVTRNFTFTAYGLSQDEAIKILQETFEKHIKRTEGFLTWDDVSCDVACSFREAGKGYIS